MAAPRATALAACLAAAAAPAGCDDQPPGSEAGDARLVVETLLLACARDDGEAALGVLTQPSRSEFVAEASISAGCLRVTGLETEAVAPAFTPRAFADARVESVHVEGGVGSAVVAGPDGSTDQLALESSDGRWLVANPGGGG